MSVIRINFAAGEPAYYNHQMKCSKTITAGELRKALQDVPDACPMIAMHGGAAAPIRGIGTDAAPERICLTVKETDLQTVNRVAEISMTVKELRAVLENVPDSCQIVARNGTKIAPLYGMTKTIATE